MRLFFVTADYTFRALFHWLRPVPYVVNRLLFPLVQLTFFALVVIVASLIVDIVNALIDPRVRY